MAKTIKKHIKDMDTSKTKAGELLAGQAARIGTGRKITLSIREREQLALNRTTEEAVAMFLDLETDHSNQEIAAALGISKDQLKRLTQTELFREKYEAALIDIGHSPRLMAVKQGLDEMFPLALRTIKTLLLDPNAPAGVRLKAATEVLGYANIDAAKSGDQLREFEAFLGGLGQKDGNRILISMPADYAVAMREFAAVPGSGDTGTSGAGNHTRNQPGEPGGTGLVIDLPSERVDAEGQ